MGKTRGGVAAIAAAGLGLLAVQPLAGSAAVLPQHGASVGAPKLTIPTATVPSVSVPSVSTPVVTTPPVTTPPVTTPKLTTPTVTTPPAVTVPSVTTPRVTTPVATVPSVTTPAVTTPSSGSPSSGHQGTSGSVGTTVSKVAQGLGSTTHSGAATAGRAVSGTSGSSGTSGTSGAAGTSHASSAAGGSSATGVSSVFGNAATSSAGERADATRSSHGGAARPGSPRAQHFAATRESRKLRRLVARLRGCLTTLGARERRLLALRAGLHGKARSAAATARILHISDRREGRLERQAVTALQERTGASCAGSASASASTSMSVSSSEFAAASTLSSVPRTQPESSGAGSALTGAHASGAGSHAGGRSGSLNLEPSGERTERAEAGTSFPSAIVTALLGLLLAIALVVVPKLRGHPAAGGAGAAGSAGPGIAGVPPVAPKPPRMPSAPKRRFTRMDPSIAPMAAQVFDHMADEDEPAQPAPNQPAPEAGAPDGGPDDDDAGS